MRPRKAVTTFSKKMEKQLKKNDHKGGWDVMTHEWLLNRAFDEWNKKEIIVDADKYAEEAFNAGMERAAEIVENQYERDGSIDQYEATEAIRKEIEK